jgi:CheY-like chemotaxis protein
VPSLLRTTSVDSTLQAIARLAAGGDEAERSGAAPDRPIGAGGAAKRILIVEDELFVAWHIEDIAKSLGDYACTIVSNGEAAIAGVEREPADLVLMDINLGAGIDGIEAARRMGTRGVPVVFVTAYSDAKTLERAHAAAPRAPVLQKPVTAEALGRALRQMFSPTN